MTYIVINFNFFIIFNIFQIIGNKIAFKESTFKAYLIKKDKTKWFEYFFYYLSIFLNSIKQNCI